MTEAVSNAKGKDRNLEICGEGKPRFGAWGGAEAARDQPLIPA